MSLWGFGLLVLAILFVPLIIIQVSFGLFEVLVEYFEAHEHATDVHALIKLLLLIPLIILEIWCFILHIILVIGGLFGLYQFAKTARNWWHKR
jgi:hypothetical protein